MDREEEDDKWSKCTDVRLSKEQVGDKEGEGNGQGGEGALGKVRTETSSLEGSGKSETVI
jgi:hypothetical protein